MPLRQPKVRSDLEYFEREIEGEDVIVVRDPVRGTYYKYNLLQAAMLRNLDGIRSLEQMIESLSNEFEVEIPLAAAERFVATARERMLLDIASLNVSDKRAQKYVLKELRKQGFQFRGIQENQGADARVVSGEAVMFMAGIRQLQAGQPGRSLDYFTAVLELNPQNKRAKQLVDIIQSAYVKALSGATTDFPTFAKFDPSRILRALDRTVGRILFRPFGWFLIVGLVAVAIYCASVATLPEVDVGAFDIALFYIILVCQFFIHETGHGLACHHFGGRVREIGFARFYNIAPVPYCDTSSSYLFRRQRDKLIVQAAGMLADAIFVSLATILITFIHPSVFFVQALQLNILFATFSVFTNLIPFLKLDGYYALCDIVGIPNLRERSFKLLKARLGRLLFGLNDPEEPLTPRRRKFFIAFALGSFVFTMFWIYHLLFRLVSAVVERFEGTGLIVSLFVLGFLLRSFIFRPLKQLLGMLIVKRRQIFTVRRTAMLAALIAILVVPWFLITWPVMVDADFVLVPKERRETRVSVPGIVQEVLVKEGDTVAVGEPLARLHNFDLQHERQVVELDLEQLEIHLGQLRSGARPEEIELARMQLVAAAARGNRDRSDANRQARLAKAGAISGARVNEASSDAAVSSSKASAARWKLASLKAGTREEVLAAAEAVREQLVAQRDRLTADLELLVIRSPIAGTVATKHLADTIGTRLEAGDTFAEIQDVSAYVAEIQVEASAPLEEVAVSDAVELRVSGMPHVVLASHVERTRNADGKGARRGPLVVVTAPFAMPEGRSGLAGHARIYGRRRSLAYGKLWLPTERVVRVSLWAML